MTTKTLSKLNIGEGSQFGSQFEMVPTREFENLSPTKKKARNISWANVNFVVGEKTKVLSNCWGEVKAGQVCAIMGPSGAGKSSLLNVLAGRSSSAPGITVEGTVSEFCHYS
jgi:ABC-type multidrug transport system ATPase subunit